MTPYRSVLVEPPLDADSTDKRAYDDRWTTITKGRSRRQPRPIRTNETNMTKQEEENKELVLRFEDEVWNERNLDAIDEYLAEDFVLHFHKGPLNGRAEFREKVESNHASFPDSSQTIEDVIAEDDKVVVRMMVRGTQDGDFLGVEPTAKEFEIEEVHIARIEDGKIVEQWSQADVLGLMEQIGVA